MTVLQTTDSKIVEDIVLACPLKFQAKQTKGPNSADL